MADLISREAALAILHECGGDEIYPPNMIEMRGRMHRLPAVDAVPISDVYRLIAGHSNYHGDNILAALTCVAEGKEVKPIRPIDPLSMPWRWCGVRIASTVCCGENRQTK